MAINVDVFFLLNLAVDYLLLWAAGAWCGVASRPWRTLAGAAAGAAYAVLSLLPAWPWLLALPVKLGMGLLMVVLAYGLRPWPRTWRLWLVLLAVSLAAGGLSVLVGPAFSQALSGAATSLFGQVVLWLQLSGLTPPLLVIVVLTTALVGRYVFETLVSRFQSKRQSLVAEVHIGGKRARLQTLVDTGHHLRDPFSGEPVLIAGAASLATLLPAEVQDLFRHRQEPDAQTALVRLGGTAWARRLRLVPYRAVGRPPGLLLGFRTDRVTFWRGGRRVAARPLTVALTAGGVDERGDYHALCSPDTLLGA